MPKYKSFDEPTKEEWDEMVSCGKRFEDGDMVEYAGETWRIKCLVCEDPRYTPTEYVYDLERLEDGKIVRGTSQFMNPVGTFIDL